MEHNRMKEDWTIVRRMTGSCLSLLAVVGSVMTVSSPHLVGVLLLLSGVSVVCPFVPPCTVIVTPLGALGAVLVALGVVLDDTTLRFLVL